MPTPDDPQRQALYAAEDSVLGEIGPRLKRWTAVEEFLESVLADPAYLDLFPHAPLDISLQRRSRSATASLAVPGHSVIAIRDGSWNALTVLHELAHLIDHGAQPHGAQPHGPQFAAVELELVRQWCGFDAYVALRTAFAGHGVVIGPMR